MGSISALPLSAGGISWPAVVSFMDLFFFSMNVYNCFCSSCHVLVSTASRGIEFCNLSTACMEKVFLFVPIPEYFCMMPSSSAVAFRPPEAAEMARPELGLPSAPGLSLLMEQPHSCCS